jgi:hypothetical protein
LRKAGASTLKNRALLGGLAVVWAVTLFHRPASEEGKALTDREIGCSGSGASHFCAAVTGLTKSLQNPIFGFNRSNILPPPETPGAVDPAIVPANMDRTICRPGYAKSARPSYAITGPLKRRMLDQQHPGEKMADYELDHLIPISLGGAPIDQRNLWLQPRHGQANAKDKNVLAYVLWRLVCEHEIPLKTAQEAIRSDWTKAYETYATPVNVRRYHFKH